MKKLAILLATLLFARENPFVLPTAKSSSSTSTLQHSFLAASSSSSSTVSSSTSLIGEARGRLLYDFGFVALYEDGQSLYLKTTDRLKRAFMVEGPKKGVFDFAKRRAFKSRTLRLQSPHFKSVAIGAHKNYWRIAIEVDPSCRLKIKKKELTLSCR